MAEHWLRRCSHTTHSTESDINPLMGTGNYSAIANNMKLVHWLLMGGLLPLARRGLGGAAVHPVPS